MKKKTTFEDLAAMAQRGFLETATKENFQALDHKIEETREVLSRAIEELTTKLSAYMTTVREDYERLQGRIAAPEKQVAELQGRRHRRAA